MINKTLKIFLSILLALTVLALSITPVFATDYLDPNTVLQAADSADDTVPGKIENIAGSILAVAQVIGVSVAVIMLIVLAIKYISAAPNDKAEIKKHAVVYIVGAVVLFGSSAILGIIREFATKL